MAVPEIERSDKVDTHISANIGLLAIDHSTEDLNRMQLPVLMRVSESFGLEQSARLESLGVKIGSRIGGILSAHIPADVKKINQIVQLDFVQYIEASR